MKIDYQAYPPEEAMRMMAEKINALESLVEWMIDERVDAGSLRDELNRKIEPTSFANSGCGCCAESYEFDEYNKKHAKMILEAWTNRREVNKA